MKKGKHEVGKIANTEIKFYSSNKLSHNGGLIQLLREGIIQKVKLKLPIPNGNVKIYHTEIEDDIVYIKNWIDFQYENQNINTLNLLIIKFLSNDYKDPLFLYTVYKVEKLRNSVNRISKHLQSPPPPPPIDHETNQNKDSKSHDRNNMSLWDIYKVKYNFSDEEISALQIYTTSTYTLINSYLRKKYNPSKEEKTKITDFVNRINLNNNSSIYESNNEWNDTCILFDYFIKLIISGMTKCNTSVNFTEKLKVKQ